jgi:hypothetical protein
MDDNTQISIQMKRSANKKQESDQAFLKKLREGLCNHFSQDELKTLLFDLGMDYDGLPGEGKESKVRELVKHYQRRGRLAELVDEVAKQRPEVPWPTMARNTPLKQTHIQKRVLPEIIAGVVVSILTPVIGFMGARLLTNFRIGVYVGMAVAIVFVGYLLFVRRHVWSGLSIGTVTVSVAIILLLSAPFCDLRPWRITASYYNIPGELSLIGREVKLEEEGQAILRIKRVDEKLVPEHWICDWRHVGDGRILESSGCTVAIEVGPNNVPDLFTVTVDNAICNNLDIKAVYVRGIVSGDEE